MSHTTIEQYFLKGMHDYFDRHYDCDMIHD